MKDTNPDGEIKFDGDRKAIEREVTLALIKEDRKQNYKNYFHTKEWKAKRLLMLERFGKRCQLCNDSAEFQILQVHHRTYERFRNEKIEDLTLLCISCHKLADSVTQNGISPLWKKNYHRRPQT